MMTLVTVVHLLLAVFWIGGTIFLVLVAAPVLRGVDPPELRRDIFRAIGLSFRRWGWFAFAGLLLTGALNLHFRGVLDVETLADAGFWSSPYGRALGWKLAAVAAVLALSFGHEWLSLRGERTADASVRERARRHAQWSGRALGVVFVLLLVAAVRLARGG